MSAFSLHPQLAADSHAILATAHSELRLSDDGRYLWLLLIPRYADLREWHDLPSDTATAVFNEVTAIARWAEQYAAADKMNIAALGNQVPQLHIHIIARHIADPAWPRPIWGVGAADPYISSRRAEVISACRAGLHHMVDPNFDTAHSPLAR